MPERFVRGTPEEGTPTLGVVVYILNKKALEEMGIEPIGYVIEPDEEAQPAPTPEQVALDECYTLLCEIEKRNESDAEMARLIASAIAWCKRDKQPEWDERVAKAKAPTPEEE